MSDSKRYVIFSLSEREYGVHGMDFENQGYWSGKTLRWADLAHACIYTEWEATKHVVALPSSIGDDAVFHELIDAFP